MLRFIVTADIHSGLVRYSRDRNGIPERHIELIHAVEGIVDEAIARKVDAMFVPGDVFHVNTPSQLYYADLLPLFRKAGNAGIEVYMIPGNHDAVNTIQEMNALRTLFTAQLNKVHVINSVTKIKQQGFDLLFVPHINRCEYTTFSHDAENKLISAKIDACCPTDVDKRMPKLVFGHAMVQGSINGSERLVMRGGEQTFTVTVEGADAYFFGHMHTPQQLSINNIPVYYPGSVQACDFGERADVKSFIYGEYEPGKPPKIERIPTKTRRMEQLEYTHKEYVKVFQKGEPTVDVADKLVKVVLSLKAKEKVLINEAIVREKLASAYWVEFDYRIDSTTATRVKFEDGQDPDDVFKTWYQSKKYPDIDLEELMNMHRETIAEATVLKE